MTDRFAFHYAPDGYSTSGPRLMGRQAAGAGPPARPLVPPPPTGPASSKRSHRASALPTAR